MVASIIISAFALTPGAAYSVGHAIIMSVTLKDWKAFFKLIWRMIDGMLVAIGHIMYQIGFGLDLLWNAMAGEAIEDFTTTREDTLFCERGITVSEAVGLEERGQFLIKSGKAFSSTLNKAFGQKRHALDALEYNKEKRKLKSQYFK